MRTVVRTNKNCACVCTVRCDHSSKHLQILGEMMFDDFGPAPPELWKTSEAAGSGTNEGTNSFRHERSGGSGCLENASQPSASVECSWKCGLHQPKFPRMVRIWVSARRGRRGRLGSSPVRWGAQKGRGFEGWGGPTFCAFSVSPARFSCFFFREECPEEGVPEKRKKGKRKKKQRKTEKKRKREKKRAFFLKKGTKKRKKGTERARIFFLRNVTRNRTGSPGKLSPPQRDPHQLERDFTVWHV